MAAVSTPAPNGLTIGVRVLVTTLDGDTHDGEVFAHDPKSKAVILESLNTKVHPPARTYHVVKTSSIDNVTVTSVPQDVAATGGYDSSLPVHTPSSTAPRPLNLELINQREQQALQAAQRKLENLNTGVTLEAQGIFEALAKTLPCRWQDENIVVMDEIIIQPPYKPGNAHGKNEASLARLRRVLENVHSKRG